MHFNGSANLEPIPKNSLALSLSNESVQKAGLAPVIILAFLFVLMAVFHVGEEYMFSSPSLIFVLNILFLTGIGLIAAIISVKSYLVDGAPALLLLGMATTTSGLAGLTAGLAANFSVNVSDTIFNIGFFFAGGLQLLSAIISLAGTIRTPTPTRKLLLVSGYLIVVTIITIISASAVFGFTPTFFAESGPTLTRQWVLGLDILFFTTSSLLFSWQYLQSKSKVIYWYSLALALLALSLLATATYIVPDGIHNWAARIGQYIGGFYFLAAVLASRSKTVTVSFSEQWAETFSTDRRQLAILFTNLLNGFTYNSIVVDKNGKPVDFIFLEVNPAFERMIQIPREKVISKKASEVFQTAKEPLANLIDAFGRVALSGKPEIFETYFKSIGKWLTFSVYSPKKGYFVTLSEDITERKQVQAKLEEYSKNLEELVEERTENIRKSEQSYRELYESFGEAFIATDWELNVIHWNKAAERVTNIAAKDALGKKVYQVLPEMNQVNIEPYLEALQAQKPARFMMNITSRETGKPSIFEISTYPSSQGIIIIVEDKTEEEQTKRLSTIGQVAGMVGHDIRNPLQAIVSELYFARQAITEMLEDKVKKGVLESINTIQEQVDYINKIVSDLQDYSKPLKPELVEADICQLIPDAIKTITVPENVESNVTCEKDIPTLKLDSAYMRRILTNLVTNAIQAMPEGGKLTVKASKKENKVIITVEDTGVGIPTEVQDKLFTPLFTTKSKGQGFGLVVVKRMTEAQGGTITFESQQGKGTKFTIKLPAE